jgi:predicted Zn-dependent protease
MRFLCDRLKTQTGTLAAVCLALLPACAGMQKQLAWRVRDAVVFPNEEIELVDQYGQVRAALKTVTLKRLLLAHFRVTRAAGVQAELLIVTGDDPNAFAGMVNRQPAIGLNMAMLKLVGDDIDEFAALLGHEAAHIALGHGASSKTRAVTINALSTLVGMGLSSVGVPAAAGTITGLAFEMIETSYSRDEEREADALGVTYARAAGFDAAAAVRIHEKILKVSKGSLLPFLSSHPSGRERIENLKALSLE